jgi:hypothetical protein
MTTVAELDPYAERERIFAERHGWRPSRAVACPRYAARKQCLYHGNDGRHDRRCVCRLFHLDHAACWIGRDGERVFTFEPYSLCGQDIVRLVAALEPLGLTLDVSGRSGWYPGDAALVTIRQETAA